MSTNAELATRFERMADLLELLGANRFRVAAFARGARVLNDLTVDVAKLAANPDDLRALEGIGKGLADKIIEFVDTGKIAEIDEATAQVPLGVIALLNIPGLGPKTAARLWREAGIESVEDLKQKIDDGALNDMPRMGEKTLAKLRQSIEFAQTAGQRLNLGDAAVLADVIAEQLLKLPEVKQCDVAGSVRRGRETIGDLDVLVACTQPEKDGPIVGEAFRNMPGVEAIQAAGPTKSSVRLGDGLQVDLRVVREDRYGAALMYFTGSKEHNVALRERAIAQGLRLNEYGLWTADVDMEDPSVAPVAADTEAAVYQALGLDEIPPTLREGRGEVKAAESHTLPKLVQLENIRAELHAHTTASDGKWSIEALAEAAAARGFHTVAVTDHSVSSAIANGLDIKRLEKHIRAVHRANEKMKSIRILAGSEVDILADGRLDYPDEILAQLDLVVASPHAALGQDPIKATDRLLRAIEHPHVHILGHPTGRLVGRRRGLEPEMDRLIAAAAATGTAMEINANRWRLDLRDTHAKAAVEAGVKLAINTDAHAPDHLDELRFGVLTAQRAWAEPRHVVNCMTVAQLTRWLSAKRRKMGVS